jgi:hypothetical protein
MSAVQLCATVLRSTREAQQGGHADRRGPGLESAIPKCRPAFPQRGANLSETYLIKSAALVPAKSVILYIFVHTSAIYVQMYAPAPEALAEQQLPPCGWTRPRDQTLSLTQILQHRNGGSGSLTDGTVQMQTVYRRNLGRRADACTATCQRLIFRGSTSNTAFQLVSASQRQVLEIQGS